MQISFPGGELDLEFPAITAGVGQAFMPWLGAEILGETTGEDDIISSGLVRGFRISSSNWSGWGLLPGEGNSFGIYALGGYTAAKLELSAFGETQYDSVDGPSYGVGGKFMIDACNGFNFQYLRHLDKDIDGVDMELDHIELDYLRRFLTDPLAANLPLPWFVLCIFIHWRPLK